MPATTELIATIERCQALMAYRDKWKATPKATPKDVLRANCRNCGKLIITTRLLSITWFHAETGAEACDGSMQFPPEAD